MRKKPDDTQLVLIRALNAEIHELIEENTRLMRDAYVARKEAKVALDLCAHAEAAAKHARIATMQEGLRAVEARLETCEEYEKLCLLSIEADLRNLIYESEG